ncbi:MAG: AAA family ATPase, partial [Arcobacter sp.]|nr:AAA family ATPase [Arcobacter sp.]
MLVSLSCSPIEGEQRLRTYNNAQILFKNKDVFLMFDEIEDVFHRDNSSSKRQKNKAWINRILENNITSTVWITNNIHSIDDAIIRRFDMVMEVPIPKKSKRIEILNKFANNQVDKKTIKKLAKNKTIAPALISRAAKVVASLDSMEDKDKAFKMLINNTLKAQGYLGIKKEKKAVLVFDEVDSFLAH